MTLETRLSALEQIVAKQGKAQEHEPCVLRIGPDDPQWEEVMTNLILCGAAKVVHQDEGATDAT